MKPRKPYRSPFWRPELDDPPASRPTAREPTVAPPAQPNTRPSTPHRSVERAAPERSVTYAPSDLALFGRLAVFGNRTEAVQTHQAAQPPRREPSVRARAVEASGAYTSRDASLFQSLEAVFSATRSPPSIQPTASASPTRSYSPADLEAFAKLAKFGRSG